MRDTKTVNTIGGHTHSTQSGWWFCWSWCLGGCFEQSRCSCQCDFWQSWGWWAVSCCGSGSCWKTKCIDRVDWTGPDTTKKQPVSPEWHIHSLAPQRCKSGPSWGLEKCLSEDCLDQLRRNKRDTRKKKMKIRNKLSLLFSRETKNIVYQPINHIFYQVFSKFLIESYLIRRTFL